MNVKMRLLPEDTTYSKTFHILFSTLCKSVERTAPFYKELAKVRSWIKMQGIDKVVNAVASQEVFSDTAQDYFEKMRPEIAGIGTELQSRTLTYLLCLKD